MLNIPDFDEYEFDMDAFILREDIYDDDVLTASVSII